MSKMCSVDKCEKPAGRNRICYMHQSRWNRNKSFELKRISLKNDPSKVIESIKTCKVHGDLEYHNIYFVQNSSNKFCKLCQHIQRKKRDNKKKNETKYLELRKELSLLKCEHCLKIKPKIEFYKTTLKKKNIYCKECFRYFSKESDLKLKFGLSMNDYNVMLEKQNHKCAICGEKENVKNPKSGQKIKLSVDHCHNTNKIRGLLCNRCNFGIGYLKDSIDILQNAIKYLKTNEENTQGLPEKSR